MTFWVPLPSKFFRHYNRMLGQHYKADVDLLSYFLDAKLKHCSQMKLNIMCLQLRYGVVKT